MHIAHVDRQRSWTGQISRLYFVCQALRDHGHDVTLVAHPGSALSRRGREDGMFVIEAPMRGVKLYTSIPRVARTLRARGVDALHCHGGRDQVLAFAAARLAGIPHVVRTKHNHTPPGGRGSVFAYHACARVIAVSEYVRDILVDGRVDPDHIDLVPDGVDLERFRPRTRDPELARSLGIDPQDRVIGNVSSLHQRKGIDDVLRAYARLRQGPEGHRIKCLLAGKQCDQWRPLVRELGIEDGVIFPGFRDDVPEMLSLLDVYVLMSRREALGTSVLEAMAMERPVVVSDVGGLKESVAPGTGVRCELGDLDAMTLALQTLLADADARARMGAAGRERVATHYADTLLADRTLAVYERVLGKDLAPA